MGNHAVRVEIERPLQGGNGFFEGALFLENSRAKIMQPRVELVRSQGFLGPVSGFDKLTEVGARARQQGCTLRPRYRVRFAFLSCLDVVPPFVQRQRLFSFNWRGLFQYRSYRRRRLP